MEKELFGMDVTKEYKESRFKWWMVIVALAVVAVAWGGYRAWSIWHIGDDDVQSALLSYGLTDIDEDHFGGRSVRQQVFAGAYRVVQEPDGNDRVVTASFLKLEKFRDAKSRLAKSLQPGAVITVTDEGYANVAKFRLSDLRTDLNIDIEYALGTYRVSAYELTRFMLNRNLYNGYRNIVRTTGRNRYLLSNLGTRIAKPGDPTLKAFAESILDNAQKLSRQKLSPEIRNSAEYKTSLLLLFVTNEIRYAPEQNGEGQVVMRPNEVLMQGRANCAGKIILFASLMEQLGLDYRIVYLEDPWTDVGHVALFVPKGNHPSMAREKTTYPFEYEWHGKRWLIAESTSETFMIGVSQLKDWKYRFNYIQKPSEVNKVWDVRGGQWRILTGDQ